MPIGQPGRFAIFSPFTEWNLSQKSVIQIGMIGFGNVGQGVYRLLEKNRALIEA